MFADMFDNLEKGESPAETFYDGYIVNAIIDASYKSIKSKKWEKIKLDIWRGKEGVEKMGPSEIKREGGRRRKGGGSEERDGGRKRVR